MARGRVLKERFPPYCGAEWEKKINEPSHPNFWKYGVANLIFLELVRNEKLVLDVGCGTGGSTHFLAKNSKIDFIVGVDIVRTMVQVAKEKTKGREHEDRIEFIVCDGRQLPFKDSSFEALVSRGDVLPWLIPQDKALQEFNRIMKPEAIVVIEMDNTGAKMKVNTTYSYFEKTYDGKIAYVINKIDTKRNHFSTSYILKTNGDIAQKILQTQEFTRTRWFSGEGYSLKDVEKETIETRRGLATHWYTAEELRELFETCGFKEIEIIGDGLFMKLLLEGNERMVEFMKKQPDLFFEIEKSLIPFMNPDKTPTIMVKGLKK